MRNTLATSSLGSAELEPNSTFNVVIAYEDLEAGKQAKKTYDYLARNLGHECRFSYQMWSFQVLGIPQVREMATSDVMAANIIIISCARANSLPLEVKTWLDQCLAPRAKAIAIVFLYGDLIEQEAQLDLTQQGLAATAAHARCEFFAQSYPGLPAPMPSPTAAPAADWGALPLLTGVTPLRESHPQWGINE
jgi:hypothetical protein